MSRRSASMTNSDRDNNSGTDTDTDADTDTDHGSNSDDNNKTRNSYDNPQEHGDHNTTTRSGRRRSKWDRHNIHPILGRDPDLSNSFSADNSNSETKDTAGIHSTHLHYLESTDDDDENPPVPPPRRKHLGKRSRKMSDTSWIRK